MGVQGGYLGIVGYTGSKQVQIIGEDGSDDKSTLGSAGDKGNFFHTLTQRLLGYKKTHKNTVIDEKKFSIKQNLIITKGAEYFQQTQFFLFLYHEA